MPQGEMHWYLVGSGYHYCDHYIDYTNNRQGDHVHNTTCGKRLMTDRFPMQCPSEAPVKQDFIDGRVCRYCAEIKGVKDEWPQWTMEW